MSSPDPFGWQQPPITPMTAEERIEADDWVEQDLLTRDLASERLDAVVTQATAELAYLERSGASAEAIDLVRRRIAAAAASRKFVEEG
ncbi:hypothetical protein GS448_01320 [Rhodococcus hoagii]|uniref:hypothetical protein n=1 Tax=Rhodococcus hoagii TaxID=43767 RepID=UPI0011A68E24|nr:hypothetical protein [Prescottella equi]MBM4638476.1 hypothetical protein [Prescottella equi]MBM4665821.1 hypothetical protein [Prescottella equi]NKV86935.1 hypothetical protein [Prescottella equi]